MADQEKLALPGNSYETVGKILHAYALCGDGKPATLDEVSAKAGMDKTIVSRNNGFLVSLGLLTNGKAKTLTADGKTLAVAIGHDLDEDIAAGWRKTLLQSTAARPIIDMIRVQKGIKEEQLAGKIAQALGEPDANKVKTGINGFIEILEHSALVKRENGMVLLDSENAHVKSPPNSAGSTLGEPAPAPTTQSPNSPIIPAMPAVPGAPPAALSMRGSSIPIHVNIELHLPASSEQSVYDALFKSIRENLLS